MISSIFSFEITNVVPEPRIFYKLPADAGAAVNCGGIKTLQVNDVITFFFWIHKPVFIDDPRSLPRYLFSIISY